jgi:molybdopterin molybdotransferase
MIELEEALNILKSIAISPKTEELTLVKARGRIIAEDVYSDINMPPFNKSAMDGYACRKEDLDQPLKVVDYIPAGSLPKKEITRGECSQIMTGAKIPEGADCVIMVEHTKKTGDGMIEFLRESTKSNICTLGEDVQKGDKVIEKGAIVNPAVIATAASFGKSVLRVFSPPRIALIATGDELVEINETPSGPSIRNSNSYNLMAQIEQCGSAVNYLGIVPDDEKKLKKAILKAFEKHDILILTGGVSMGEKDYVPEILEELGLKLMYDKLAIQPGKPTTFACGDDKFCFGLSGNPVSSMLQFELTAKPFIYYFMCYKYQLPFVKMKLSKEKKRKKTDRMQFFPVQIENGEAMALEFHGSAHITGLIKATGFGII